MWTSSWANPFHPDLIWTVWGKKVPQEWAAEEGDAASEGHMVLDGAASDNSTSQLMIEDAPESEDDS